MSSSALDEELIRLEDSVAKATRTADLLRLGRVVVGTNNNKKRWVEPVVVAADPSSSSSSSCRQLSMAPLDGALPPRLRQTSGHLGNDHAKPNETEFPPLSKQQQKLTANDDDEEWRSSQIEYYKRKLDQCTKENEQFKQETTKKMESIRELRRIYLFGLQKVSKLQDLREAPDAIMPGNFVQNYSTTATTDDKA